MYVRRTVNLKGSVVAVGLALTAMALPAHAQEDSQQFPQSNVQPPLPAPFEMPTEQPVDQASQFPSSQPSSAAVNFPRQADQANDTTAPAPKRLFSIVPRVTVGEVFTDNVAPGSGSKTADQITEISPGIHVVGEGARLKLYLDYQLREFLYAQQSERNRTQNTLNAFGTLEAIEKWMFVDFSGVIAQQQISPFGIQTVSDANINPNRSETSNFRVSPYVRGKLAGYADYELRYSQTTTQVKSSIASDIDTSDWSGKISGATPLTNVNWAVDADRQTNKYSNGRNNEADHVRGLISYKVNPQFKISVSAGQESNNYQTPDKETHSTHGYGFDWYPTERTQISAFKEKRFFGDGHTFSFSHRTPLSAVKYSDTRDVSTLPNQFATVSLGNYHDLFFNQLASSIPDPVLRADFVDKLLEEFGILANEQVVAGFLTSRVHVRRLQQLTFALTGARNLLAFTATRTEDEALGPTSGSADAFLVSQTIRQLGYNVTFSHRLTPLTTLIVSALQQNSKGGQGADISSKQQSLLANISTRLGPKTTANFGFRRTHFDNAITPAYDENAVTGTLSAQF